MAMDSDILLKLIARALNARSHDTAFPFSHQNDLVVGKVIAVTTICFLKDKVSQLQWPESV